MPELTDEQRALVREVERAYERAEQVQRAYRTHWDELYELYRTHQSFRKGSKHWRDGLPNDVDRGMREARREWGADLHIPYAFSTIETIVPRMLSHRPRMLILPKRQESEQNVQNVKLLIDAQQDAAGVEMELQDVAKSGLIYGLGVSKVMWRTETKSKPRLEPSSYDAVNYVVGAPQEETTFDGPDMQDVDIRDFFWDPLADSMESARFVIHRTWCDHAYVMAKIAAGTWTGLETEEDVRGLGGGSEYGAVHAYRNPVLPKDATDGDLHEVWEYHDGDRVITVLDRAVPVQSGPNPCWHGELPFQVYRPTRVPKEMVGIGEIEPIRDLIAEMDTLRSQRRDNATLKLQQVFAAHDGLVLEEDLQFKPGGVIWTNGDPRNLLFPINVGDIPNSGYQEEQQLQADIERTTGISDPVTGGSQGGGSAETATGAQLVQAAANLRIQNKTRRLEVEVIKRATEQFIALSQQHITEPREIRVVRPSPDPNQPSYEWPTIGPEELKGEFDVEGGATQPENTPQERQDGQLLYQMFSANPLIEQQQLVPHVLRKMGVETPEAWLAPQTPQLDPNLVMEGLVNAGMDPETAQQFIMEALQVQEQEQTEEQGGPAAPALNGNGAQPEPVR